MARLILIGLLCTVALAASAPAQVAAPRGRIVVASEGFAGMQLGLIEPDGTQLMQRGILLGARGTAAVSPDGTTLVLVSTVLAGPEEDDVNDTDLYRLGWIGHGGPLSTGQENETDPTWSPDGARLAFASDREGSWDVYVAPVARVDTEAVNLTRGAPSTDRRPRWSPDGRWIAFESDRGGDVDVYVVPVDGSASPRNLTNSPGADLLGDWSPDSTRLAVSSVRTGRGDVYVLPVDGGTPLRVTSSPGNDSRPAWGPDGSTLAFTSDRDGDSDVFTIRVDGSNETRLTRNVSEDVVIDWQPLRDLTAPVVRALPSKGRRNTTSYLRYRINENSRRAEVAYEIEYRVPGGSVSVGGGVGELAATPGRTYTLRLPSVQVGSSLPQKFRFCVRAVDPSANESRESCSSFTFVKPKPKRKR
jgi:Tol biopolymer transport system component